MLRCLALTLYRRGHTVIILGEDGHLAIHHQLDAGQTQHLIAQDAFDMVLGDPLHRLGKFRVFLLHAGGDIFEQRQTVAEQTGGEDDIAGIVAPERRGIAHFLSQSPAPHMLHRAHIGGLGARLATDFRIALHLHGIDAALAQFHRHGQPHRPTSDNQNVSGGGQGSEGHGVVLGFSCFGDQASKLVTKSGGGSGPHSERLSSGRCSCDSQSKSAAMKSISAEYSQ